MPRSSIPLTPPVITLTTLEELDIPGRGHVHLVAAPFTTSTLTVYTQHPVWLDGSLVHIHHIEGFGQDGFFRAGTRLGLILRPLTGAPLPIDRRE